MICKYDLIQILLALRDKMNCKEDKEIIQNTLADLLELDQEVIKEKYNMF